METLDGLNVRAADWAPNNGGGGDAKTLVENGKTSLDVFQQAITIICWRAVEQEIKL